MGNNIGSSMQNSMEKPESGKTPFQDESFGQPADIRGKEVFDNPELCAQFLRDYSGIP